MARGDGKSRAERILGADGDAMRGVAAATERAAEGGGHVLFAGECGTGRSLAARVLHGLCADAATSLEIVDASALAAAPGQGGADAAIARAGERAARGVFLVREVEDLPLRAQRRLVTLMGPRARRAGAGGSAPRVIATAGPEACGDGALATVLSQRVVHVIRVPALRERAEDIPGLARRALGRYARALGGGRMSLTRAARERLVAYSWPGNVAELRLVCKRLALGCGGVGQISSRDVDRALPREARAQGEEATSLEDAVRDKLAAFLRQLDGHSVSDLYDEIIRRAERPLFDLVLERTGGNQVQAAEMLGLNRNTLRRKLAEHGLRARARTTGQRRRARGIRAG